MNIERLISEVQQRLGLAVDGRAGVQTWGVIHARICADSPAGGGVLSRESDDAADCVDERSERVIATLHPKVRPYARALVHGAARQGLTLKVISGTRSYDEQAALYAQGRTAAGPKVTNAPAGHSNHNFGIAFDIGVFDGNAYLSESPAYKAAGALGRSLGLEWGGDWRSIRDEPHFQLRPGWAQGMPEAAMLAGLRERKAGSIDAFAAG